MDIATYKAQRKGVDPVALKMKRGTK